MGDEASLLPLMAVIVPVVTAVFIVVLRRWPQVRDLALFAGALTTLTCVLAMLPAVLAGTTPTTSLGSLVPGFALQLRADGMGMVFAVLAAALWTLAAPYAVGYMRGAGETRQTRFYAFYALCLATAFGVAFSGDLFTFFIFYELLTASTYPLVTHKGNVDAIRSGRKYLGYLLTGGVLVLLGLVIVVATTGDVTFVAGGFVAGTMSSTLMAVTFVLFAIGFATKAGVMPLHAWLPAAMVAPTPVSALLHAVAVVKAGVFAFGRLIGFVFGPKVLTTVTATTLLAVAAATTILVASVVALRQDALKRRLAFSTIAHLAYMVLGFALLAPRAIDGALLHMVNHGVLKITLFFCAGALYVHAKIDRVSQLDGIGRRMPWTMGAFALASLGLAGLPPMGGFLSKWALVEGAYRGDQYVFAAVMVGAGLLTASYLFPIVHRAFFRPAVTEPETPNPEHPAAERRRWTDASPLMVVPLITTAVLGLLLGLADVAGIHTLAGRVAEAIATVSSAGAG